MTLINLKMIDNFQMIEIGKIKVKTNLRWKQKILIILLKMLKNKNYRKKGKKEQEKIRNLQRKIKYLDKLNRIWIKDSLI